MYYDLPGWATGAALAVAFVGMLMALVGCIPDALSSRRWDLAASALAIASAIFLGLYAGSQDTYYSSPIRRWDSFSNHRWLAAAAFVCTAVAAIALIAARWSGRAGRASAGAASFLTAAGFGLQLAGYVGLSLGH